MSDRAKTPAYLVDVEHPIPDRRTAAFLQALNSSGGAPMETLAPAAARQVLVDAQAGATVKLPPADVTEKMIHADGMTIKLFIVRPTGVRGEIPAFMFFHGGGWVIGDFPTHERFVRDVVVASGAAAVFVEYDRSPEVRYPVPLNQAYAATKWVAEHGKEIGVDGSRLAVVGNSAGGNLAAAVALKAKHASGPSLRLQVLFWPVTDARFDTPSYEQFQDGHFLTRAMMRWFWGHYVPDEAQRAEIYASPLRATLDQLRGLPPAVVQTAELDVLRDEGEGYARKLDQAGVDVVLLRVGGMIHDYGLLNALSEIPAVEAALRQAGAELRRALA
jgi:acetyl esterase